MSEDEAHQDAELYIEPIIAWRSWIVEEYPHRTIRLTSLNGSAWEPGVQMEARCRRIDRKKRLGTVEPREIHEPPGVDCHCGIYAARDIWHLRELAYVNGPNYIVGKVALMGAVVPGDQGYRAARAYPVKFYIPNQLWRWAVPLKETYGVPFRLFDPDKKDDNGHR